MTTANYPDPYEDEDCLMCDHPDREYEDQTMVDLGGGMVVPLRELLEDDDGGEVVSEP